MSDWNLPPGVSVNDIPGNQPEDAYFEDAIGQMEHDYDALTDEQRGAAEISLSDSYDAGNSPTFAARLADKAVEACRWNTGPIDMARIIRASARS